MSIRVKICGLTNESAVQAAIDASVDYVGFVFFPRSPRHISLERAAELKKCLPDSILSVAVVVDPDDALVKNMASILKPHAVQLHGKESLERVAAIRKIAPDIKIIKAISVASADDIAHANAYEDVVDGVLFDSSSCGPRSDSTGYHATNDPVQSLRDSQDLNPGGNGLTFDWNLLKNHAWKKPWFLSGGLHADNVQKAIAASGAKMVDISSGVESAPGVKDTDRIRAFIRAAKA